MLLNKLKKFLFLAPAVVLGILVGITAFSYDSPSYKVQEPQKISFASIAVSPTSSLPEVVSLPVRSETTNSAVNTSIEEVELSDSVLFKDGTYEGSSQGFGGKITVSVTIANGNISAINVVEASSETPSYFEKAKAVLTSILASNSTNVDTISGATYSSRGLINATKNALLQAAYDPAAIADTVSEEDTSSEEASSDETSSESNDTTDNSDSSGNDSSDSDTTAESLMIMKTEPIVEKLKASAV